MKAHVPPADPGADLPEPPPEAPAPPADPPAPDPQPPVEPDPQPLPSPQPPGVDAPLEDEAGSSLSELVDGKGLADVRVVLRDGVALLRGVVEEPRLREQAARLASALDGVDAIENEIGLPSA